MLESRYSVHDGSTHFPPGQSLQGHQLHLQREGVRLTARNMSTSRMRLRKTDCLSVGVVGTRQELDQQSNACAGSVLCTIGQKRRRIQPTLRRLVVTGELTSSIASRWKAPATLAQGCGVVVAVIQPPLTPPRSLLDPQRTPSTNFETIGALVSRRQTSIAV